MLKGTSDTRGAKNKTVLMKTKNDKKKNKTSEQGKRNSEVFGDLFPQ